jgi:hypothetical protein
MTNSSERQLKVGRRDTGDVYITVDYNACFGVGLS